MRVGAALLTLLVATPALAQTAGQTPGPVAPINSAVPHVVRAMWLEFPEPTCAPRIRVAIEAPLSGGLNVAVHQDRWAERLLPLRVVAGIVTGDGPTIDPAHGAHADLLHHGWGESALGFAPRAFWRRPERATLKLSGTGAPLAVDLWVGVGEAFDENGTWRLTPTGSADTSVAIRGTIDFLNRHDPFVFATVVPAATAERLPVDELASWRAHALGALGARGPLFYGVGQQMGWDEAVKRPPSVWAAIRFFALVPGRTDAVRGALRRLTVERDQPSPIRTALALADDPWGACKAYNRGGRGKGEYVYLKQVALGTEHADLRRQARQALENELGPHVIAADPQLRERFGVSRAYGLWAVTKVLICLVCLGLLLRSILGREEEANPVDRARSNLVLGGFLLWVDPVYLGIDLLPDALGYLALVVAGRRLLAAEQAWYPRWAQQALIVGAVLAVAVTHTPVPPWTAAVAGVALTIYGVGLCLGGARYLDASDKAWSAHAARLAAGLVVLALPFELVLGVSGGVGQVEAKLPAMFQAAVYPGLFLIRFGLPVLLWAVVLALRPELHAAAQERKAESEIPALERERRPPDPRTPPPEY